MREARLASRGSLVIALLMAVASLAGIVDASTYARETASWRTQGVAQDWVDLVVAAPWLVIAGAAAGRGSRRGQLLLAGGLIYVVYSFAIYAFAVHANRMFLIYCAVLGLAAFALLDLARSWLGSDVRGWFDGREPRRAVAGLQMASAIAFGGLWLAQEVPAALSGVPPAALAETGLLSNPVHVLDLALVLPALFAAGLSLWRGRAAGYAAAVPLLGFAALMDANITVLTLALGGPAAVSAVLAALTVASAALLVACLRACRA